MTRNTEKRIELAYPVYDHSIIDTINSITEVILNDNVKARQLQSDGTYAKKEQKRIPIDSQQYFSQHYRAKVENDISDKVIPLKKLLNMIPFTFKNTKKYL